MNYFIRNWHAYTIGTLCGFLLGWLVMYETQNIGTPDNLLYHYGSFLGGLATLIAAGIAYVAAHEQLSAAKTKVSQEQDNFKNIIALEINEVKNNLVGYLADMQQGEGARLVETGNRDLADMHSFEFPQSLNDYQIISKLRPDIIKNVFDIREGIINIKETYYNGRNTAPIGLRRDAEELCRIIDNTF